MPTQFSDPKPRVDPQTFAGLMTSVSDWHARHVSERGMSSIKRLCGKQKSAVLASFTVSIARRARRDGVADVAKQLLRVGHAASSRYGLHFCLVEPRRGSTVTLYFSGDRTLFTQNVLRWAGDDIIVRCVCE